MQGGKGWGEITTAPRFGKAQCPLVQVFVTQKTTNEVDVVSISCKKTKTGLGIHPSIMHKGGRRASPQTTVLGRLGVEDDFSVP